MFYVEQQIITKLLTDFRGVECNIVSSYNINNQSTLKEKTQRR